MSSETGFDPELYKRFPTTEARPEGELEQLDEVWCGPRRPWEWITAINNNYIGVYYVGAAMLFFVLAGVLALLMRTQLALPMTRLPGAGDLQPDLHHARHGDDVPVRGARGRGAGRAVAAADAGGARSAVPEALAPTPSGPIWSAGCASSPRCSSAWRRMAAGSCIRR
jgi:hypothetical protein